MRTVRMLWARVRGQAAQGGEDEIFDEEIRGHIATLEERFIPGRFEFLTA